MTRDQATRTQISLAERGVEFVHVAATDGQRATAELEFMRALPAYVFSPARKSMFRTARLASWSCEHVAYLFIQDASSIPPKVLEEVKHIAGVPAPSKRQPVTYYVE